jgi:hypothetical protein
MTIPIPTLRIGQDFDPNNATLYEENSEEARVYQAVKRSEAKIDVVKPNPRDPRQMQLGSGTGTIVTSEGIVVTDRHNVVSFDGSQIPDDKITVTVDGKQYQARVLADPHRLGIRTDQAALQIIAPAGETFVPMRIASGERPGARQWAFGYSQGSNNLFMSPVYGPTSDNPDGIVTRGDVQRLGVALQPGEDPNRQLHRSPVHIEPGNSGGARVQIGADGQPELLEMAEISNTDHRTQIAAADELQRDEAQHLRPTDVVNYVDASGMSHSALYKDRRQYLQDVINAPNCGWFTTRQEMVSFLDDVTGRRLGEGTDVHPPGSVEWSRGRREREPQPVARGAQESREGTTRDQYGTIAEHIMATHAKSSVESYYLKQFMG